MSDTPKKGPGRPRKKAPEVSIIDEVYRDDRAATVQEAKDALGEKAEGMSFCYRSAREHADTAMRLGYVPVMKPDESGQYYHKGDPLFMRPKDVSDKYRNAPAELAKAQLENAYYGEDGYDGLNREQ